MRERARHACVPDGEDNSLPRRHMSAVGIVGRAGRSPLGLDDPTDALVLLRACHGGSPNRADIMFVLRSAHVGGTHVVMVARMCL